MSACLSGDPSKDGRQLTAQQPRMRSCNAQAGEKDLKGDERKRFMSECLKGDNASSGGGPELTAQQQRMRSGNTQASKKDLEGEARKKFMSRCLQG
jgi:conjugal transfer/entry exclusion protein